jgi:hypothetical protein
MRIMGTVTPTRSYLSKLPVDTLKIDRPFVIDMTAAPNIQGLAEMPSRTAKVLKR